MKKVYNIVLLLSVLLSSFFLFGFTIAKEEHFEIVESHDYYFENNQLIVLGNRSNISTQEVKSHLETGKTLFVYDYYLDDNIFDNNASTSSAVLYVSKNVDILDEHFENFNDFKFSVSIFFEEKFSIQSTNLTILSTSIFSPLYTGSFRYVQKPYGYIDVSFTVEKYRSNDVSSLYLVTTQSSFSPGSVAYTNGDTTYDEKWQNYAGYLHVGSYRSFLEFYPGEGRKGGTPVYKDAFPINQPGVVTIGSTYTVGINLGYSFTNGFSLTDVSTEYGGNIGVNIERSYSKSFTYPEPAFSAQLSSVDTNVFQWNYQYVDRRNETNHLTTGYMFEMNNYNHDLLEGDVGISFATQMTVRDPGGWWFWQNPVNHTISTQRWFSYY